jgi:hypothetical protein
LELESYFVDHWATWKQKPLSASDQNQDEAAGSSRPYKMRVRTSASEPIDRAGVQVARPPGSWTALDERAEEIGKKCSATLIESRKTMEQMSSRRQADRELSCSWKRRDRPLTDRSKSKTSFTNAGLKACKSRASSHKSPIHSECK